MSNWSWNEYWKRTMPKIPDINLVRYFTNKPKVISKNPCTRAKILEVGCGNGSNVKYLRELGFPTNGIDICEEAIRKAICPGIWNEPIGKLAEDMVFDCYDYIVDIECLTYCTEEDIRTVHKALKPNGKIFSKWFTYVANRDIGPWHSLADKMELLATLFNITIIESISRIAYSADEPFTIRETVWEGEKI